VDQRTAAARKRTARWPVVGLLVVVALAGGCSREFGGKQQDQAQSTSLADVRTKLDFIQHDTCFREPSPANFSECGGRYLRQLQNVGQTAGNEARKHPGGEGAVGLSQQLNGRIQEFHQSGCDTPTSDAGACVGRLNAIDADVNDLSKALAPLASGH
jgi:hypothetical protein